MKQEEIVEKLKKEGIITIKAPGMGINDFDVAMIDDAIYKKIGKRGLKMFRRFKNKSLNKIFFSESTIKNSIAVIITT